VHLTVSCKLIGEEVEWRDSQHTSRLTYDLPGGYHAGQSVVKDLEVDLDYVIPNYITLY